MREYPIKEKIILLLCTMAFDKASGIGLKTGRAAHKLYNLFQVLFFFSPPFSTAMEAIPSEGPLSV